MSRTLAAMLLASASIFASAPASIAFAETTVITQQAPATIHYRSMKIDGVNVFYREAGPTDDPSSSCFTAFRHRPTCSAT